MSLIKYKVYLNTIIIMDITNNSDLDLVLKSCRAKYSDNFHNVPFIEVQIIVKLVERLCRSKFEDYKLSTPDIR